MVGVVVECRMKSTRRYYDYRKDSNERLGLLEKKWFQGKACLDIGCSSGLVTLEIARLFSPRTILGIDVLQDMIDEATNHLHNQPIAPVTTVTSFLPRCLKNSLKLSFPQNCHFQCQNILTLKTDIKYETITCFNVTKWIHLYEGDAGLVQLFWKIWESLKCEGLAILEYQPWSSYVKNRNTSPVTKENFLSLRLRPESFEELLTQVIGFEIVVRLGSSLEEAKGFHRPILVLQKPSEAQYTREERELSMSLSGGVSQQGQSTQGEPLVTEEEETRKSSKKKKRKLKERAEEEEAPSVENLRRHKRSQINPPSEEEWAVLVDRSVSGDATEGCGGDGAATEDKTRKPTKKKSKKRSSIESQA
jgi:7SK snRNA methylphosphate capping enzyme